MGLNIPRYISELDFLNFLIIRVNYKYFDPTHPIEEMLLHYSIYYPLDIHLVVEIYYINLYHTERNQWQCCIKYHTRQSLL